MNRRTTLGVVTVAAVVTVGLVAWASAFAFGHGGGKSGMMKRFVAAAIDDALDQAKVTPEQRTAIHAVRDRVITTVEQHRRNRSTRVDEALALFEADQVDPARVEALAQQGQEDHRRIAEAVRQAILEVHDLLSPEQRRLVADYVRSHRPRHM